MIRWDAVAAIVASLVGLLALVVAGYTAYIQRQQVSAQVWPYLIGGNSSGDRELLWINKGVGPAIVRDVRVTVDGKPQSDWKAVLRTMGFPTLHYYQSTLAGNVLSPGEKLDWIKFNDEADYRAFMAAAQRVNFEAVTCYCSTLGECWTTRLLVFSRQSVRRCLASPESEQFHD
ncbi:MAG TPA: hypothetical protein VJ727_10060 [Rhodanobacteraceae bacterium]|nr:hypothetical protein [Rhodanobacteraceae bacterium]